VEITLRQLDPEQQRRRLRLLAQRARAGRRLSRRRQVLRDLVAVRRHRAE
jgi:hypothetical protein